MDKLQKNEEMLSDDELSKQVREFHRRIQSINTKMESLHDRCPEVKRFIAYMQAIDGYQKAMDHIMQALGFQYAMKNVPNDKTK